ncbi:hypothetical protein ACFRMO_19280 [Streptomyces anulatus]|uniref:hypothetical protein n=1 Tax=Streptomyces anulatus TaxID=1892 RepID=UPI003687A682
MTDSGSNETGGDADGRHRRILTLLESCTSADKVLELPSVAEIRYDLHSPFQGSEILECIKNIWMPILERRDRWQPQREPTETAKSAAWRSASLALSTHFAAAISISDSIFMGGRNGGWSPFLKSFQTSLLTAEYGIDAAIERRILSEFCAGWWDANFMEVVGSAAMGKTPVGYDLFVFWSLEHIAEVALAHQSCEHLAMGHVLSNSLARRAREAVDRRDRADIEFRDSHWRDAVSARELAKLASRQPEMIEKYGYKNVEGRFEESLSLLMQSLGFMVVPTRQGQRRVDMICISPGGDGEPFTILVEAKSSHNNYTLPTKDSRAIAEYVDSVRSRLRTLPPLKLVLIVGPEGSKTLPGKVKDLDVDSPVPVRYVSAGLLNHLRYSLRGVVPPRSFLRAMVAADGVVVSDDVRAVVATHRSTAAAHSDFIAKLLEG